MDRGGQSRPQRPPDTDEQIRADEAPGHIAELKRSLDEKLRFETLMREISSRFINLPADQIDSDIEAAQRRICELLDLDRSTLFQTPEQEPGKLLLTHISQPPENLEPLERLDAKDFFPWTSQKLLDGEKVIIAKMTDLQPEADLDRKYYDVYGTRSVVCVPLLVGDGPVFGLLTFAVTREERNWPESVVKGFELVAQVFSNALARKKAEESLRESEAKLSVATDAAGTGLWVMDLDTGSVWVSPKTRELFHFAPDEDLTYHSFFKVIHPEDGEKVDLAVQQALQSGEHFHCDYRIVRPDGKVQWICSRGQRHDKPAGESSRFVGISLDITERVQMEERLKEQLDEIEALKQRLEQENLFLLEEVRLLTEHSGIVAQSAAMKKVLSRAEQVAPTDSTVLLLGETGTGKELLAREIHGMSSRNDRPLVTVNCAAMAPTLIESDLFGREKGAYTGALTRMTGRFELAHGSTIFLDEIGEIPIDLQSKLLRVLEDGRFERLGSSRSQNVDVRIIAATNRDLEQDVKDGRFRQDLFYRLNVFPIVVPSLRERPDDIPLLVWKFIREFQKRMGKEIESIPKQTMRALQSHSWPGNVRELRNLIENAMILSKRNILDVQVPRSAPSEADAFASLEDVERMHVMAVLEKTGWRISGQGGAAEVLGLKRSTLQSKIKKLGIRRSSRAVPK